jgi:AAA+ ATPase superfamily predicted ATPase
MEDENPFLIRGYESPQLFCDREEETRRMLTASESKRNITLISLRRMGKTGLIRHVLAQTSRKRNTASFYLDLLPTTKLEEFIQLFGNQVVTRLEPKHEQFLKKIGSFFSGISPTLKYDATTGEPSLDFSIHTPQDAKYTLDKLFAYIDQQEKKIIIAFDEFQQILNYPEKNIEALLRSNIQACKNASYIFSGSQKGMLVSMFSGHGKPFFQNSEILHLEPIDPAVYSAFITTKFKAGKRKISTEGIAEILRFTRGHTWYVQYICNKLYSTGVKDLSEVFIAKTMLKILHENEVVYYNYRNLLTSNQWLLLRAISKEDQVRMILSAEFIRKHGLGGPSSVKAALDALIEKEMVYEEETGGTYRVYDVFLSRWLSITG